MSSETQTPHNEDKTKKRLQLLSVIATIVAIVVVAYARGYGDQVISFSKAAGLLLIGLSVLVIIHEFGHFIAAKAFGMRVERFYLFFDAFDIKLFSFKRGDTEYGIGWLPLGGYVKISGLVDENMDKDFLQSEPQPWEYRSKPVWQRLIVMVGGVVMNVILGILILSMMKFYYGDKRIPMDKVQNGIEVTDTVKVKFKDGTEKKITSIGHVIGFKTGDEIVSYNGEKLPYFEDYSKIGLLIKEGYFEVKRNNEVIKLNVPDNAIDKVQSEEVLPELFTINIPAQIYTDSSSQAFKAGIKTGDVIKRIDSQDIKLYSDVIRYMKNKKSGDSVNVTYLKGGVGEAISISFPLDSNGKMGVYKDESVITNLQTTLNYGFLGSFVPGTVMAFDVVADNIAGLGKIFTGNLSARKSMTGIVGMGQVYNKVVEGSGFKGFLMLTGLISMMLAFANIFPLPLPVLDGGHVVFLLIEWIMGKPVPMKIFFIAQNIGLVVILGLMILTNLNDVLKLFGI